METLYWEKCDSPVGQITLWCSDKGLRELAFGKTPKQLVRPGNGRPRQAHQNPDQNPQWIRAGQRQEKGALLARQAVREVGEYAAGKRSRFTVPLDLQGTPFQKKVWKALLEIPCGETRSYQEIARRVGNPRASRAVGTANGANPVAIVVPCHRVIASDGSLGGYAGGLDKKTLLLRMEQESSSHHKDTKTQERKTRLSRIQQEGSGKAHAAAR